MAQNLTLPQIGALIAARDLGCAFYARHNSTGGAYRRMVLRLMDDGLLTDSGRPWAQLTDAGGAALEAITYTVPHRLWGIGSCAVLRCVRVRHHTLNMFSGDMRDTGRTEWRVEPCHGFGPVYTDTHECKSCVGGWTHPENFAVHAATAMCTTEADPYTVAVAPEPATAALPLTATELQDLRTAVRAHRQACVAGRESQRFRATRLALLAVKLTDALNVLEADDAPARARDPEIAPGAATAPA